MTRRLRLPRVRATGLRVRLIAAFIAVALLSSMLGSGIAYLLVRRAVLQRTQDAILNDVRETLARTAPPTPTPSGRETADFVVSALAKPGRYAAVVHVDGSLASFTAVPPVQPSAEFLRSADTQLVFQRVVQSDTPYFLVGTRVRMLSEELNATPTFAYVVTDLTREAQDLDALAKATLIANGIAVAAALLLGLLAARGVLRPVRRLGKAALALGEGRLDTRVAVRGRDELADLAKTFNTTAAALEQGVTELRTMDAASRRFVADVSHELRTPLTTMTAVTDVLAEETAESRDGGRAAHLVIEEIHRLKELVDHLIEISRFDASAAGLVLDEVSVASAIKTCLSARGWTDSVEVSVPPDLMACFDPRRFDVIMANVVGNAHAHGTRPIRVTAAPRDRDDRPGFRVTVADQGPGISPDLLPLVFDRFVKGDSARRRSEGSGLGLSIARANAELHGGTLVAANSPEGGAIFTLWLPREAVPP